MYWRIWFGRNYKWLYLFRWSIRQSTAYNASTLSWIASRFFRLLCTILIWKLTIDSGSTLFKFDEIFTYYILGGIFTIANGVQYNVANNIQFGTISTKLLRPCNTLFQMVINDLGWQGFRTIVETALFSLILFFGFQFFIFVSWQYLLLSIIFFVIGNLILINVNVIFGSFAFWMVDTMGLMDFLDNFNFYFSGRAIPLNLVSPLLSFTPIAFLYFVPMQVYFGKYSRGELSLMFGIAIFWLLFTFLVARIIFKIGLKKNESVGL